MKTEKGNRHKTLYRKKSPVKMRPYVTWQVEGPGGERGGDLRQRADSVKI